MITTRTCLLTATACLLLSAVAAAQQTFSDEELAVTAAMRKPLERVDLDALALADALTVLSETAGVNISADWKAMAAFDVRRDTPVTLHLKSVRTEQALRLALAAAAGPGALDFIVRGRGVLVGPPEVLKALPPLPKPTTQGAAEVVAPGEAASDADRAALRKLQTAIPVLVFDDVRLEDVLLYLRRIADVSMYIDWAAIRAVAATPETRITARRKDTTAAAALQLALARAAPGRLGFAVADGVVLVSTRANLETLVAAIRRTRGTSPADNAVVAKLQTLLPVLRQEGTELQTMLAFLQRTTDTNLFVNWRALKTARIKPTTPVSLDLRNVTAELALVLTLAAAAGPGKADFTIGQAVVLVSTPDDATRLAQRLAAPAEKTSTKLDAAVTAKLAEKFPVFDFTDLPLRRAIEFLREAAGVNVFVDWRALKPLGASGDTPVALDLKGISCRTALQLMLTHAAGTGTAAYRVHEGIVYISAPSVLKRLTVTGSR